MSILGGAEVAAEPGVAVLRALPAISNGLVVRSRLLRQVRDGERIVQVHAPAGSGKTVLVRSLAQAAGLAGRVAWVPVHRQTHDPRQFWAVLIHALQGTKDGSELVRSPAAAHEWDGWAVAERLLEDLSRLRRPLWLVIDDVHELRSEEAQRQLELLVTRAPEELRIVLATRRDLRLGLHRLRLEGRLTDIRATDLRFTLEEARALLASMGVGLPGPALAMLQERAEGWAAGLRFAALAPASHPDPERFAAEFSGAEPAVAEYLLAEVLDQQSEPARRLLLRTSVLKRVNGELADLLTGGRGGELTLRELEKSGAFVTTAEPARSWFRVHPLLADLLRSQLRGTEPGEIPRLHRHAALWHAEHGHPADAVRHAEAARRGALTTSPLAGDPPCPVTLSELRLALARRRGDLRAITAEVQLLRTFAEDQAAPLPGGSRGDDVRALTHISLGVGGLWTGEIADAERCLARGVALAHRGNHPYLELEGLALWATIARERTFREAAEQATQAIELARRHGWNDEPAVATACAALGNATAWQGQLEEAELWLDRAERAYGDSPELPTEILLRSVRGTLELARGRDHEALAAFRSADRLSDRLDAAHPVASRSRAGLLHTLLRLGETHQVEAAVTGQDARQRETTQMRTVIAALRLAQDNPRAATRALAAVVGASASLLVATPEIVQAFLLEAAARDALGERKAAERAIELALRIADPDSMLTPFLLHPVPRLLREHRGCRVHASLVSRLLDSLPDTAATSLAGAPLHALPRYPGESLTDSEMRVLRYLPTHLTAREIAGQLYLSAHTVTTHMRHIYAKLDVHRRHEAVEQARARGLLAPRSRANLGRAGSAVGWRRYRGPG
jgi:LuxR family maltose regulon positive regulatory protein